MDQQEKEVNNRPGNLSLSLRNNMGEGHGSCPLTFTGIPWYFVHPVLYNKLINVKSSQHLINPFLKVCSPLI